MLQRLSCTSRILRTLAMAGFVVTTFSVSSSFSQPPSQGGQSGRSRVNSSFTQSSPGIGQPLPDVTLYTADGKEFSTGQMKGSYTVLVFGCLT